MIAFLPLSWAGGLVLASVLVVVTLVRPQFGALLLVPAIPFGSLQQVQLGPATLGLAEALVALVVGSWLLRMMVHKELRIRNQPLTLPLLLLLATQILSLLGAESLEHGAKEIVKWAEVLLLYLFVAHTADGGWMRVLALVTVATGAAAAMQGIYQFLFRIGPEGFVLFDRFMRAHGTFEQPNPYGGYLALTLPLAGGLLVSTLAQRDAGKQRWTLLLLLVAGTLMLVALVMSWSRGAWIGFAAAVVAMALVILARSKRGALLTVGLTLLMGYVLLVSGLIRVPSAFVQRFGDFLPYLTVTEVRGREITDANYPVLERLAHWQSAVEMWADHPWTGVGIGNYEVAYPDYALPRWPEPLGHAHNYYLNIGAEAGALGLLAYLAFLTVALAGVCRSALQTRDWRWGVALGAMGMMIHLIVHSMFDNLYVHSMYLQVAILLGAVVSHASTQEPVQAAGTP